MGAFRRIRQLDQRGGDSMISIGIDVHKNRCVATIKQESKRKLEQSSFDNTTQGITNFILHVKKTYGNNIQAVCESTANYWIRLHDTLEDNGIDTILAHPAKTRIIAQARLKNDKLDSDVLADLLRSEMVYESFVPEKYYRDLRSNMEEDRTQNHELTLRKKMESKSQTS
jgi:transposase